MARNGFLCAKVGREGCCAPPADSGELAVRFHYAGDDHGDDKVPFPRGSRTCQARNGKAAKDLQERFDMAGNGRLDDFESFLERYQCPAREGAFQHVDGVVGQLGEVGEGA